MTREEDGELDTPMEKEGRLDAGGDCHGSSSA